MQSRSRHRTRALLFANLGERRFPAAGARPILGSLRSERIARSGRLSAIATLDVVELGAGCIHDDERSLTGPRGMEC